MLGIMTAIENLHNRIDLYNIPFSERGSRLMLFRKADMLFIRLAERWVKQESAVGHYRKRPPFVDNIRFWDADGAPLAFELETYPHVVSVKTRVGAFDWAFLDSETLMIKLPSGGCGVSFDGQSQDGAADRRGGVLHGVRATAYTTNAQIIQNTITPLDNGYHRVELRLESRAGNALMLNLTPRLGYNRSIPEPDAVIAKARQRWDEWFSAAPPVLEAYRQDYDYAWWILRAGLMSTRYYFTREALVPSKIHYVGVWHWDQFFHALAYRHINVRLAEDQLRILLDHQQPNGMIPDAVHDEGVVMHLDFPLEADVTKPPLMAWTVLKLYETTGHTDFLEEMYEPLLRWQSWWHTDNVDAHGLGMYRHPFSSGLDDSPMWDYGMPVTAPDLNTYLVLQAESLATIADIIGKPEDARSQRERARTLLDAMMMHLWDEERGCFNALRGGERVPVLTPFHLLPIWLDGLPRQVYDRLIAHLTDPAKFWTRFPLPTVAIDDPHFDPLQMWRGPTWVNINYLFVNALQRRGYPDLARELRRKSLELVMMHDDIYEYYNPFNGERPPKAAPIFGWTSAVFIDMALQETREAAPESL